MNKEQAIKLFEGLIKDSEQAKKVWELGDTCYYTSQALISAYNLAISVVKVMDVEEKPKQDKPVVKPFDEPQDEKVEAHLAEHWNEDIGDVLWWDFPVEEPPYCGTPLDEHFPKYKTHFTTIDMPNEIEKPKQWVVKLPNNYYFSSWVSLYSLEADGAAYKFYDDVFVFDDRTQAEAVALLVDGSVEEI